MSRFDPQIILLNLYNISNINGFFVSQDRMFHSKTMSVSVLFHDRPKIVYLTKNVPEDTGLLSLNLTLESWVRVSDSGDSTELEILVAGHV